MTQILTEYKVYSSITSVLVNTPLLIQSDIEHMQSMACVSHTVTNSSDFPLSSDRPKYHCGPQYEISQDMSVIRSNALPLLLAQITQIYISHWLLLHQKTHYRMETSENLLTLPHMHICSGRWWQWNCSAIIFPCNSIGNGPKAMDLCGWTKVIKG